MVMSTENGDYIVRENGLTSFVPPCFHFDLDSLDGVRIGTVSDIDDSRCPASLRAFIARLVGSQGAAVRGRIENYEEPNSPSGVRGRRLVITGVIERPTR